MPYTLFRAYAESLGALEAEDNLTRALQIGVGTGSLAKDDLRRIQREWRDAARTAGTNVAQASRAQLTQFVRSMGLRQKKGKR